MRKKNKINSSFINSFRIGDEINYNLKILEELYNSKYNLKELQKSERASLYCKPIIILIASITEALIADLFQRATRKPFPSEIQNRKFKTLQIDVENKKHSKFSHYINGIRKVNLLNVNNNEIYDSLDTLRKMRNRIHLQDIHGDKRDYDYFDNILISKAEFALEKVMKSFCNKFKRGDEYHHVKDFELPWSPRLTSRGLRRFS